MKIITVLLLGILLFSGHTAHAETDLLLMGKSWHFGHAVPAGQAGYDVNQYNWGGGLEYRGDAWHGQWLVGGLTYRDTFRQHAYTVYGGYSPISFVDQRACSKGTVLCIRASNCANSLSAIASTEID